MSLPRLTLLRLILACAALSGSLAAASSATPDTGTCTADHPYVQSFDKSGPQAGINSRYTFNSSANTVTNTDATYLMWNSIDHTGNGGYALFMNIANYAGNNGANLSNPGLLYESRITVPAGSTIDYQNYVRSHSNTGTQLQYRFFDGSSGTELKRTDGAVATTSYTLQTVPTFVSPSSTLILRIYTLKDGTARDINALKLDDLKLTCAVPQAPGDISGKVFRDNDGSGDQNDTEPGISGVTVTATDKNGSVSTTTTGQDGTYTFSDLPVSSGPYTVAVNGAKSSTQLAGLSASTPTSTANVGVVSHETAHGGNFGYKPPITVPDTGTCAADKPYVQSFDKSGPQAGINTLYSYNSDPNVVTNTDATYFMWNSIDHTGNGGYALYMNIANYQGNNGAALSNPGLLYETQVTVPAGSTINYQNYVRSHSNGGTQLQYRFFDGANNAELQRKDGELSTTSYVLQTVPAFVSPSNKVIVRVYTLKDGTAQDINALKLDDLKLTCTAPQQPGAISGKVFRDNDGGGSQNGTEPGIGGVTVTVTDKNGVVSTTTTGSDGTYSFPNLPVNNGPYTVAVDGVKSSTQLAGLSASTPISTANVSVIPNQTVPGGNFGYKPPLTTPDTGVCTAAAPYVQSFDKPGPQAGINTLYTYNSDPNVVTNTDATYLMWNSIDHTGNGGYALYMNIANYAGNNNAVLTNPGLLYESRITVPAGSTIDYQNYVRSHSNGGTQLQYRFLDGSSGAELKRTDGAPSTTGYVLQTVPAFVSPSSSLVLQIYTLKDGTAQDINALKLDDLKLTCTAPLPPKPVVDKTVQNITVNGPVTKETTGKPGDVLEYCITATHTGGSNATKLGLGDNIPNSSQALPGGYGAGKDIKFTGPDLVVKYLTLAADADTGQLLPAGINPPAPPRIVISDPALTLSPGQMFQVCFRTTIN